MVIATLISLRETFEASIVVCVMLAFLNRIRRRDFLSAVWSGVACGVTSSILCAVLLAIFARGMPEELAEAYEGAILLAAAVLIFWMTVWMAGEGKHMKRSVEESTHRHVLGGRPWGVFLISFLATAREGMELAFLSHVTLLETPQPLLSIAGIAIGIVGALLLSVLLMYGMRLIPMRAFFWVTSLLLLLLGTHLAGEGLESLLPVLSLAGGAEKTLGLAGTAAYFVTGLSLWYRRS